MNVGIAWTVAEWLNGLQSEEINKYRILGSDGNYPASQSPKTLKNCDICPRKIAKKLAAKNSIKILFYFTSWICLSCLVKSAIVTNHKEENIVTL